MLRKDRKLRRESFWAASAQWCCLTQVPADWQETPAAEPLIVRPIQWPL